MRIYLKTQVKGKPSVIINRFDKSLFEALTPPGASVKLLRFDGSKEGDEVHIRMSFLFGLIKQNWFATIVEDGANAQASWFVDEGTKLPFFLSSWRHRHLVESAEHDSSYIIDDIHFKSPLFIFDPLLYPVLWLQFAWRKPIYRKIFGTK